MQISEINQTVIWRLVIIKDYIGHRIQQFFFIDFVNLWNVIKNAYDNHDT